MHCCSPDAVAPGPPSPAPKRWLRRFAALLQWALPITTLALIPKCPACIAGYILLFTGIGLSFPAAAAVRWSLIALSTAALAYLLLRTTKRALWRTPCSHANA
jgi:hypothetical protein